MTARLYITRGLPGSGKTHWAREFVNQSSLGSVVRLNRDDLRSMMLPTGYRIPAYPAEKAVTAVQHGPIVDLLKAGVSVIVDDTNLPAKTVRTFAQMAVEAGADWTVADFLDVPLDVCVMRDKLRDNPVGEGVINDMHRRFFNGRRPAPFTEADLDTSAAPSAAPYVPNQMCPPAVMVDIDGTVALHTPHRGPYDTSRYHLDRPNDPVIEAIENEMYCGNRIVFCSGRDETFREVTEQWLRDHVLGVEYCTQWELFMRPAGDRRNDAVVKLELFDKHIRDNYRVLRCYDDRDRVVQAWRSIGLTVLQVAPGNF